MSEKNQDTGTESVVLTDLQRVEIVKQDMKSCIELMKLLEENMLVKKKIESELEFYRNKTESMEYRESDFQDVIHTDKELQDLMKEMMTVAKIIECYE